MELFTATGKIIIIFWQLDMFDVCTTCDTAHIDTIFKFLPHRYSSLLQWSVPLGQRGHVTMLLRVLCTKCTLHSNHGLTVWYSNTQNNFSPGAAIFSLHTLASPSSRNVNYDEKLLAGGRLSCSFYLYRFHKYMSYGFPIINFCNPGVHYETPCIIVSYGSRRRLVCLARRMVKLLAFREKIMLPSSGSSTPRPWRERHWRCQELFCSRRVATFPKDTYLHNFGPQ